MPDDNEDPKVDWDAIKIDGESLPYVVARLDERQRTQEREIGRVRKTASYALEVAEENKLAIANMPENLRKVLREENKGKRMEIKEWILVVLAFVVFLVSLPAMVQSLQSLGKQSTEKVGG